MGALSTKAERAGREAHHSDWLDHVVRAGLVAYGVVHVLIAWVALQLAFGDASGQASSSGALQMLADEPLGTVAIWAVAVGMLLLVAWRLLEAVVGHQDEDGATLWRKRATSVLKAVLYGSIGVSALGVVLGSGSSGSSGGGGKKGSSGGGTDSMTATILSWPGGQLLVGAVALAIIGYGISLVVRAYTEKFAENLTAEGKSGDTGTAYVWLGKVGHTAKGIAIVIVGGLFGYAAITHEANKSGGLDQALQQVRQQPFGPYLLMVIAVGIACYGIFCFARARHLSR